MASDDDEFSYLGAPTEAADSVAPGNATFRFDDSRASQPYYVDGGQGVVRDHVLRVLGRNEPGADGTIRRTLPLAHPKYRDLYAVAVQETGYGVPVSSNSEEGFGAPVAPDYAEYPHATLQVEFAPRDYALVPDDELAWESCLCYDDDGGEVMVSFADEWKRFTAVQETFDPKIITAQQGQLIFARKDTTARPHKAAFPGSPRLPYPESTIKVTWFQVPWRYVSSPSSYLKILANRVNQLPWRLDHYSFEPGELLYTGYTYKPFRPPFPRADPLLADGRAYEKWVDLELVFGVARRRAEDPPELPNPNWIARGHNVLPSFVDRKFHYVCSFKPDVTGPLGNYSDDPAYWQPIYFSGPLQLLFMDPDVNLQWPLP